MNRFKVMPVVAVAMVVAVVSSVGCKKSTSSSAASTQPSQSSAVGSLLSSLGTSAMAARAQGARPGTAVTIPTYTCASGGNISFSNSSVSSTAVNASTNNYSGAVTATLNNCVYDGYTFAGTWTETFNATSIVTPPPPATATAYAMSGTLQAVTNGFTINGQTCTGGVNLTDTLSVNYNAVTSAFSGSITLNGSVCGVSNAAVSINL
jgi:hypothetical protein